MIHKRAKSDEEVIDVDQNNVYHKNFISFPPYYIALGTPLHQLQHHDHFNQFLDTLISYMLA